MSRLTNYLGFEYYCILWLYQSIDCAHNMF